MDKINIKSKPGYLKKAVYIFSLAVVIGSGYSVWQTMKTPTKEPQVYVQESCNENQDCGANAICIGDFGPSENLDSIAQFRLDEDGYYYTMITEDNNIWQTKYKPGEGTRATFKWSFQEWSDNIDWSGIDPIETFNVNDPIDSMAIFKLDEDGYYYTIITQGTNLWQTKYKPGEGTIATSKWNFQEWSDEIDWNGIDPINVNDPIDSMNIFKNDGDGYYYTMITQGTNVWQTKYKPGEGTKANLKWSFSEWINEVNWEGIDTFSVNDPIGGFSAYKRDEDGYYYSAIVQGNNVWQTKYKPGEGTEAIFKWSFKEWFDKIDWGAVEAFKSCDCECGYDNCNDNWADGCEADLLTDVNNCGGCGFACNSGEICEGAECVSEVDPSPSPSASPIGDCSVNADCDDDNPCTEDACIGGECSYGVSALIGQSCPGGFCEDGVCVQYPDSCESICQERGYEGGYCDEYAVVQNLQICEDGGTEEEGYTQDCYKSPGIAGADKTCCCTGIQQSPFPSSSPGEDLTKLNMQVKLDGVPANNIDYCCLEDDCDPQFCNLLEEYRQLPIVLAIQAEDDTYWFADVVAFKYNSDTQKYHSSLEFSEEDLPSGGYNFLIKGLSHRMIRFCQLNQGLDDFCPRDQFIEIQAGQENNLDFTAVGEDETVQVLEFGDVDFDQVVGVKDYSYIKACLNSTFTEQEYGEIGESDACWAADGNYNGVVDDTDKYLFQKTITHKQDDD